MLVAAEEGLVDLDEPAGPPGSTFRHLLAHASGLPFEQGPPVSRPGARRVYSNYGFEVAAALVEQRAEMPFADYFAHVWRGTTAVLRGSAGVGRGRDPGRPARARARAAGADAARARDARGSCHGAVPGARRRPARASAARPRTTGGSGSSCATRRPRTGPARGTPRRRSATSAGAARSSGSTPWQGSRSAA